MGHAQFSIQSSEAQHPTFTAGSLLAQTLFNELMASGRRYCAHVPPVPSHDGYYRTVLVVENEPGYFDMGAYSKDLRSAEREASASNQRRGLTEDDAVHIVFSSLKAQNNRTKRSSHGVV